jgi:signal transduction histidine kinase/ActR/RegA family two-component response regulator
MQPTGDSIRVLHVDDDPDFVETAALSLERVDSRFDVETATSAADGLDRIGDADFQAVVSDFDMPSQNGIEFLEDVRIDHPDLPFILFTGKGSEQVASEAISAGVTDYIQKQPGADQYALLANRIDNAVSGYIARQEVDWHQTVLQNMGEGVYVFDDDYVFQYVNFRIPGLESLPDDSWTGKPLSYLTEIDLLSAAEVRQLEAASDRLRAGETDESHVVVEPTVPEATEALELRLTRVQSSRRGDLVLATSRDVTDRQRREEDLARQNDRLEEFARVLSHDLRNPLNVAAGRLELASEDCTSPDLQKARGAVDRSLSLLDDLQTMTLDGLQSGPVETVDLASLVERCWETVQTASATLEVETARTFRANPSRLKQVIENLVRNAIEHGGTDVTVTVGDLEDGFYVADDGAGIPEPRCDRVFSAGYSSDDDGTGFGLSIVEQIVDAHGWAITVVESEAGGARFEITGIGTE